MLRSKAIDILMSFTASELKIFNDYLQSPLYCKNKKVVELAGILITAARNGSLESFTDSKALKKYITQHKLSDQSLRNLFSAILNHEYEFLTLNCGKDKAMEESVLLKELYKRNVMSVFETRVTTLMKRIASKQKLKEYDLKVLMKTHEVLAQHFENSNDKDSYAQLALNYGRQLAINQLANLLKQKINETHNEHLMFDTLPKSHTPQKEKTTSTFLHFSADVDNRWYLFYQGYKLALLALTDPDNTDAYTRFKDFVTMNFDKVNPTLRRKWLYLMDQNCNLRLKNGHGLFLKERMWVHKVLVNENVLNVNDSGWMNYEMFLNIIDTGLVNNETAWTEEFVSKHISLIAVADRESLLSFSMGLCELNKNNFKNALRLFQKVELTNLKYKFGVRSALLKIYFELNYYDQFVSLADAFKKLTNNHSELNPVFSANNLLFIKLAEKLFRLKLGDEVQLPDDVHLLINKMVNYGDRKWLNLKGFELIKKGSLEPNEAH